MTTGSHPSDAADRIVDHLDGTQTLLLLDNCEHVLDAAARLVLRLLDALPGLRILTTSREPLGIGGERVHLPAPLAVPDDSDARGAGALDHVPAVQLLIDRARDVLPEFAVTAENRGAIVALCRRLDGLPLAIELAAVRLRSLSVSQVVERLDRRFTLLAGSDPSADPRQRSLRALIDWSHDLCGPDERLLWQRMAVFPAAAGLATIEQVCGFRELAGERLLDGLVGKSVVVAERRGEHVHYRQFVTLREYGAPNFCEPPAKKSCAAEPVAARYRADPRRAGASLELIRCGRDATSASGVHFCVRVSAQRQETAGERVLRPRPR